MYQCRRKFSANPLSHTLDTNLKKVDDIEKALDDLKGAYAFQPDDTLLKDLDEKKSIQFPLDCYEEKYSLSKNEETEFYRYMDMNFSESNGQYLPHHWVLHSADIHLYDFEAAAKNSRRDRIIKAMKRMPPAPASMANFAKTLLRNN